jgi:hypothetical protein
VPKHTIQINRAPVLTLWAAVVAERLGYDRATALTLGRAVAGLNAQAKGRRLHIFEEPTPSASERLGAKAPRRRERLVPLLGRSVPVVHTGRGLRAIAGGSPIGPASVERYLKGKFESALPEARAAMQELAEAYSPERLDEVAFTLYEQFRPRIPEGARGWGARGELNLDYVRSLASEAR